MNTTTIELACLGLAFGNETAAFNRQRATDKTWGQLLREEGFLRS